MPSNDESLEWMRQIQTQMRICETENGVLRNLWKRAKTSGENIKMMRETIAECRGDFQVAVLNLRDKTRYLTIRKVPVTPEAIFSWDEHITEKTEQAENLWEIEEAGYKGGRMGLKIEECPHPPGSEYHTVWLEWWNKGQASIAKELGPDAEQAPATRERPMRGASAKAAPTAPIPGRKKSAPGRKKQGRRAPMRRLAHQPPSAAVN